MAGGGFSWEKGGQKAGVTPQISDTSSMLTGTYLRDMPSIIEALRKYIPGLSQSVSGANMASLQQLLGTERGYNQQQFGDSISNRGIEESANAALYPEIAQSRIATGKALQDMLNPNLSGSELSNIERGMNRQFLGQGTFNTPNNLQQIQAATTYGNAGRDRMAQGLQLAPGGMSAMTSSVAPNRYQQKNISEAFAKTGDDTAKMLFTNPAEQAGNTYASYMGNQVTESKNQSKSKDIDI